MTSIETKVNSILALVKTQSLSLAEMKIVQSDLINKQEGYTKKQDYLISIIESNDKINKKGLYEQVNDNTEDVKDLKTKEAVQKGQIKVVGFLSGAIGAGFLLFIEWLKNNKGVN